MGMIADFLQPLWGVVPPVVLVGTVPSVLDVNYQQAQQVLGNKGVHVEKEKLKTCRYRSGSCVVYVKRSFLANWSDRVGFSFILCAPFLFLLFLYPAAVIFVTSLC